MPSVDVLSDMRSLFATARALTAEDSTGGDDRHIGARHVVVITPGRILLSVPLVDPRTASVDPIEHAKSVLRTDRPLSITAVSYTKAEAMGANGNVQVPAMNRSIPFLGHLMSFAYAGHTVIVFEGHPSAFEAGVRNSDVLIIDSAMLPFLQKDWAAIAFAAMAEGGRIFVHQREGYVLLPVAKANTEAGWRYTEPDGETSYANCLLTTISKGRKGPVRIVAGSPLPDLAQIATDPAELEWISTLPFKYDRLDAEQVIEALVRLAKPGLLDIFSGSSTLKGKFVSGDEVRDASFRLTESRSNDGRRQLDIELR